MLTATGNRPALPLPPAPGAVDHSSLDLANSIVTLPGGRTVDLLSTPEDATRWLVEHGLTPEDAGLQEYCADRLSTLRRHMRALLGSLVDGRPPADADVEALNRALTLTPTTALLDWAPERGLHRATAHPTTQIVEHALASLAADAADLLTGPHVGRLAACQAPPCNRYLLRTHARRHWCSTRCGDRVRAARAYARRTESSTA
ncbi:ABATE domain-containing protein [Georgenia sp. SUBG003]|uniref:ABATE domain-containing protein n=1 Tax=Georgenia sp. SUBG003 TaxID=1497974 RepID=UPI0004D4A924|nr:hypothetical protein DA06_14695 [Georgenia sp. SUBG003]